MGNPIRNANNTVLVQKNVYKSVIGNNFMMTLYFSCGISQKSLSGMAKALTLNLFFIKIF